jgi:hypothetical protein
MRLIGSAIVGLLAGTGVALAFPTEEIPTAEPAYLAKVKTAAPAQVVAKATILMPKDGKEISLQTGSNGFTCLIDRTGTPLCADENAMAWRRAVESKTAPPDKVGFIYMLAGDSGTPNHDPDQRGSSQHRRQHGPHVMVVGPMVKDMPGYSRTPDVVDPTQPYAMRPGTPYEHLMLPVTAP